MARNPLGSIFKRTVVKDGQPVTVWDVRKRIRQPDGSYRDRTRRCHSYAEAQIALANLASEDRSERVTGKRMSDLVEYYRREYCKPAVMIDGQQIAGYRQNLRNIELYLEEIEREFGPIPVAALTYEHLRVWREKIATRPTVRGRLPAASTVNRRLAYLRRILNIAVRLRWIQVNPFGGGEPLIRPGLERIRERVLSFTEEERLLEACDAIERIEYRRGDKVIRYEMPTRRPHLRLVVLIAIDTGMRQGEIFRLRRSDIDLARGVIRVRSETTKTLKARLVPVSSRLAEAITQYLREVFVPQEGELFLGLRSVKRSFANACKRAHLKDLRFHDLRHTAATWMDQAGISHAAKLNIIGHSSAEIHQRYHNTSDDVLDEARRRLDEYQKKRPVR